MTRKAFCLKGHPRSPDNLYSSGNCKTCNKEQARTRWQSDPAFRTRRIEESRKYQKSSKWKDSMLRRDYGISLDTFNEMRVQQSGRCLTCGIHEDDLTRPLNVDHCHVTNKVRGLLCCNCNTAIGLLKENITVIDRVKQYLEKSHA